MLNDLGLGGFRKLGLGNGIEVFVPPDQASNRILPDQNGSNLYANGPLRGRVVMCLSQRASCASILVQSPRNGEVSCALGGKYDTTVRK
jgi:hypothetical protein